MANRLHKYFNNANGIVFYVSIWIAQVYADREYLDQGGRAAEERGSWLKIMMTFREMEF